MKASRAFAVVLGLLVGLTAGWTAGQRHLGRHRANLFSPRQQERMAALGYLAGRRKSVETARLLRDYVQWEYQPSLRRRGERLLRRVEAGLT